MVDLETATHRAGDVTLVECRLESDGPRRVRVVNRLAGPVWPPRRRGVPAEGWDGDGVTVTVEGRVGVGYATPAPPADPPAAITAVEDPASTVDRAGDDARFEAAVDVTATRAGVVRELSDPRPPSDAIPAPDAAPGRDRETSGATGVGDPRDDEHPEDGHRSANGVPPADARVAAEGRTPADGDASDAAGVTVDDWLSGVERRIERLEAVDAATTLPEATAAVAAAGGLDGVESLAGSVATDADRLDRLARRARALAGRATAADPDLATLRRLA